MNRVRISRFVVSAASLFFAALAVIIWVAPEYAATRAGVETVGAAGVATVRADFGGLFAGLSVLCGAAWTSRRTWMLAAATMLTAIVAGRVAGWIGSGGIGGDVGAMAIELAIVAALVVLARGEAPATARRRVILPGGIARVRHVAGGAPRL